MAAPVQGGEPRVIAEQAGILDWTRDGRFLAIFGASAGSKALSLVPVKDGAAEGTPMFVRYGAFQNGEGRTTTSGALIYASARPGEDPSAFFGSFDSAGHVTAWKPLDIGKGQAYNFTVDWSPDSSQIAYVSSNDAAGLAGAVLRLRNITTGEEREIYRSADRRLACLWSKQRPLLFCAEEGQESGQVFTIEPDSGQVRVLPSLGNGGLTGVSSNDRALYFLAGGRIWRWEIATGQRTLSEDRGSIVSPDEQWQLRRGSQGAFDIRNAAQGTWTPLLTNTTGNPTFTPDSKMGPVPWR
jgi:hypothetical protein